ncbi:MAG TPA: Uma2 family endonuclease [Gemmataceae bacterium]|nr:Uma2 family endonuclease [Gemmataceae bacterium]
MAAVKLPAEQRFVLYNVDWDTYVTISDKLGERNIRLNYDGVNLEFMSTSLEHERAKKLLARLLETVTEEMDIDILGAGSMTCRRQDLDRGFEPDESYWIAHEAQMRGRVDIDLMRDPPPDLMLEVEISRSFVDRLALAARLGVPEVWRWDREALRVMLLNPDGQYSESECSRALPFLPVAELVRFLNPEPAQSETKRLRDFRDWVRQQMAGGWGGGTATGAHG